MEGLQPQRQRQIDAQAILDTAEINRLINEYVIFVDRGQMPDWIWAEHAVVLAPGGWRIVGHENVMNIFTGKPFLFTTRDSDEVQVSPPIPVALSASGEPVVTRHNVTSSLIQFQGPNHASGISYWISYRSTGLGSMGEYIDRFEKIGQRWYIAERKTRFIFVPEGPEFAILRSAQQADDDAARRGARW